MTPGTVVLVAEQEVGVVVRNLGRIAKVMAYQPRNGRWSSPMEHDVAKLSEPPPDHRGARMARDNIKRNLGVLPYGGSRTQYARVWPDGRDPSS